jgi:hypothetical protein
VSELREETEAGGGGKGEMQSFECTQVRFMREYGFIPIDFLDR